MIEYLIVGGAALVFLAVLAVIGVLVLVRLFRRPAPSSPVFAPPTPTATIDDPATRFLHGVRAYKAARTEEQEIAACKEALDGLVKIASKTPPPPNP